MRSEPAFTVRSTGVNASRVFPFYVVCDVSQSMWDPSFTNGQPDAPLSVVEDSLHDLLTILEEDPATYDTTHLAIVAFGDSAVQVLPLTPLAADPLIPVLPRQTSTDYAEVFSYLDQELRRDAQRLQAANLRAYTPVMFVVTDGNPHVDGMAQPESVWLPARRSLESPMHPFRPIVIALGIGQVTEQTIGKLRSTTPSGVACVADDNVVPDNLLGEIVHSIRTSITASVGQTGEFQFRTPKGMRRVD